MIIHTQIIQAFKSFELTLKQCLFILEACHIEIWLFFRTKFFIIIIF